MENSEETTQNTSADNHPKPTEDVQTSIETVTPETEKEGLANDRKSTAETEKTVDDNSASEIKEEDESKEQHSEDEGEEPVSEEAVSEESDTSEAAEDETEHENTEEPNHDNSGNDPRNEIETESA